MKVTVEHNGVTIWYRDSESGEGVASRGYLTDGTQQKIVTALIDALTKANGEMSLSQPLQQVSLTASDEQLKEIAEELRTFRASMPVLYFPQDTIVDSPKIKITTQQVSSEKTAGTSINCLEVMQLEIESALKYIKSEQCKNPNELAVCITQSLMDYCLAKVGELPENNKKRIACQRNKWWRCP
ncbi:hypothetical protein [Morganella psychrotolerans]|uniref:hypothetical protein n=1 Tax=Morganella psychrotolerans TaxID=368603 RepID=UPI0039AEDD63